jgi:hypothetical protein
MGETLEQLLERYKSDAFWDTPLSSIDPRRHRDFVVERLLQYGGLGAIHWLLDNWGTAAIRTVVVNSRNLSRMTAGFWAAYLDIPRESIRCLTEPTLSPLK